MACLQIPVDFEMRDDVRRLGLLLRARGDGAEQWPRTSLYVLRIWVDWARTAAEWRPLDGSWPEVIDWTCEIFASSLEDYCGWAGGPGELICLCLQAGVLRVERRGDLLGLTLRDFWLHNSHLSPDHLSIQRKGGLMKAANARARESEKMADQQLRLLQGKLEFPPDAPKPSAEEGKRAVSLIIRVHRACGLPVPSTNDYSAEMLGRALDIVRHYSADSVGLVERYLHASRDRVDVSKQPARVLGNFDEYFKSAQ